MRAAALLLLLFLALPARAEQVIADLSQNQVSITTSFEGSDIFVYGAIARTAPVPEDAGPLDVIVEIVGPSAPVTVRRKERVAGIWVNTDAVEVDRAPHFIALASTRPIPEILSFPSALRHRIGYEHVVRFTNPYQDVADAQSFREAIIRIREREGLYRSLPGAVRLTEETLFSTRVDLPANLVEGDYRARVFLLREGEVRSIHQSAIRVEKSGLERWIFDLAHQQPLVYGLGSIFVALVAGWLAAQVFAVFRR
ncbi:MAG: TIGR02186 family protein [Rubricella sp.]